MTDRELLELAAKAAGFIYKTIDNVLYVQRKRNPKDDWYGWNPLTDDADALRLAVKLKMDIWFAKWPSGDYYVAAQKVWDLRDSEYYDDGVPIETDPYAATRRVIVRAAAEIGKKMK